MLATPIIEFDSPSEPLFDRFAADLTETLIVPAGRYENLRADIQTILFNLIYKLNHATLLEVRQALEKAAKLLDGGPFDFIGWVDKDSLRGRAQIILKRYPETEFNIAVAKDQKNYCEEQEAVLLVQQRYIKNLESENRILKTRCKAAHEEAEQLQKRLEEVIHEKEGIEKNEKNLQSELSKAQARIQELLDENARLKTESNPQKNASRSSFRFSFGQSK